MKKSLGYIFLLLLSLFSLSGCDALGSKTANISVIYLVAACLALAVLVLYVVFVKSRDAWYIILFSCVFVVNAGYFWLSVSKTLDLALLANRVAYLGSVFLPMAMTFIILRVTRIKYSRWLPFLLSAVGVLVFLIAASPGILDVYYSDVRLVTVNGVSVLEKVYGPLHITNLIYLLGYFIAMIWTVTYAYVKKTAQSPVQPVILSIALFFNIGVWFVEQFVSIEFEILSVSYIICELFLLALFFITRENERLRALIVDKGPEKGHKECAEITNEEALAFTAGVKTLTPTERAIFNYYVERKSTREVMAALDIKENTLKFHNKNIYGKLGVPSRRRLVEIYNHINK